MMVVEESPVVETVNMRQRAETGVEFVPFFVREIEERLRAAWMNHW